MLLLLDQKATEIEMKMQTEKFLMTRNSRGKCLLILRQHRAVSKKDLAATGDLRDPSSIGINCPVDDPRNRLDITLQLVDNIDDGRGGRRCVEIHLMTSRLMISKVTSEW